MRPRRVSSNASNDIELISNCIGAKEL